MRRLDLHTSSESRAVPGTHTTTRNMSTDPKLYNELAPWWPLMSAPHEYGEEAEFYARTLQNACAPRTVLELGSGGGNNASHLKAHFSMTLVELAPGMLEVSRRLNPECEHVQGDMRTVRLDRQFDAVFVHDAVSYMTSEADLRAAIDTAFAHCREGGAALFAPDHVRENFRPSTDCGGNDGEHGEGLRYLEWSWDPDPADTTCITDYAYVIRERDGTTRAVHDRHVEGLFAREQWLRFLTEAGFEPSIVPFDHTDLEPGAYELFVARRPG